MAGYMCDSEDGQAADFLITNLGNGDTMAFCAACLPAFAVTLIESLRAGESQDGATSPEIDATAPEEGEATPSTPARKRRRTPPQAPQEEPPAAASADALPSLD